ncbi:hypothetical protein F5148DRAFT_151712 [Russula earlei]|uniref:Uncharacterized protein n=1 Tax=Russula earlei TaxID=71964 RepID=A0ACC0U611_9AGAM|nr:hypothetical protein F5148DRAFT_151712 [Russula earlei]
MFPLVVALVLAVGLPLLPFSLYRALHLPSLKFNFLLTPNAPEQFSVPSPEATLFLESGYSSKSTLDAGGSSQYLIFSNTSSPQCLTDTTDRPVSVALREKQHYSFIWELIHAQLLYQLAEAAIIIAVSFFVTAIFFSPNCLSTLMDRLCTAFFISRQYTPKAALSSFLEDVLCGLRSYWKDSSVSKNQDPCLTAKSLHQAALDDLADTVPGRCYEGSVSVPSLISASIPRDDFGSLPLDQAQLTSGSSSSVVPFVTPSPTRILSPMDSRCTPFPDILTHRRCETRISEQERPHYILGALVKRQMSRIHRLTTITDTASCDPDSTNSNMFSHSKIGLSRTVEASTSYSNASLSLASSPVYGSTTSRLSPFSLPKEDSYNSTTLGADPTLLTETPCTNQKASTTGCSSRMESISTSPGVFQHCHRRDKSDGIQASTAKSCLEDITSPLSPENVDVSRTFWEIALQSGEGRAEALDEEAATLECLPMTLITPRKPEHVEGSSNVADVALGVIVVTPEGELIVPASQRLDGSTCKDIKARPGHSLREPLAEKYCPPAARRRTSTWHSGFCEDSASPPSSLHLPNSLLPPTPISQRRFVHHDSPAGLSDSWHRTTPHLTVDHTPPTVVPMLPSMNIQLSAGAETEGNSTLGNSPQACSALSTANTPLSILWMRTIAAEDAMIVNNQDIQIPPADRGLSRHATLGSTPTEEETASTEEGTEATRVRKVMGAAKEHWDRGANRQPDVPSVAPLIPVAMGGDGRRSLQEVAYLSTPALKAAEYLVHSPTTSTLAASTLGTVTYHLNAPLPIREHINSVSREATLSTSLRKRKALTEPHTEVLQPSDPLTPHLRPRTRHSAPHLGQYANQQQVKGRRAGRTPESSKRRRMRTASAGGVENWYVTTPTSDIDRTGRIVLPAGTGWKTGRSSAANQQP